MPEQDNPSKVQIADWLLKDQPAEWVRKMIDHHRRTGTYRSQDLRRLLGDQTKGVEIGPNSSLASNMKWFGR